MNGEITGASFPPNARRPSRRIRHRDDQERGERRPRLRAKREARRTQANGSPRQRAMRETTGAPRRAIPAPTSPGSLRQRTRAGKPCAGRPRASASITRSAPPVTRVEASISTRGDCPIAVIVKTVRGRGLPGGPSCSAFRRAARARARDSRTRRRPAADPS